MNSIEQNLNKDQEAVALSSEQKGQIRDKLITELSTVEGGDGDNSSEQEWLDSEFEQIKKQPLEDIFNSRFVNTDHGRALSTEDIALLTNEVRKRVFLALRNKDHETAKATIKSAHRLLSGTTKINREGEKASGCICDECADFGRLAGTLGFSQLEDSIRHGSVCPEYNSRTTVDLESFFRHDSLSTTNPEEYEKSLQHSIDWHLQPNHVKAILHQQYRSDKLESTEFKDKGNEVIADYLKLAKEYNEAVSRGVASTSFDGDNYTVRTFPGSPIELPDQEPNLDNVLHSLEKADRDFKNFGLHIYVGGENDKSLASLGTYPDREYKSASSMDFLEIAEVEDREKAKNEVIKTLNELLKYDPRKEQYDGQKIDGAHSTSKKLALIAAVLHHLGEVDASKTALEKAKEMAKIAEGFRDYNSKAGEKYLAIALAEIVAGDNPSQNLDWADHKYMSYFGGFESTDGIGPSTRMFGLQSSAKLRVLADLDPSKTIAKLKEKTQRHASYKNMSAEDYISGVTENTQKAIELWQKIRAMIEKLKAEQK